LGNVEDIAIDGYDYLKTPGESKHNIYIGIQCKKENRYFSQSGDVQITCYKVV